MQSNTAEAWEDRIECAKTVIISWSEYHYTTYLLLWDDPPCLRYKNASHLPLNMTHSVFVWALHRDPHFINEQKMAKTPWFMFIFSHHIWCFCSHTGIGSNWWSMFNTFWWYTSGQLVSGRSWQEMGLSVLRKLQHTACWLLRIGSSDRQHRQLWCLWRCRNSNECASAMMVLFVSIY